MEDAEEPLDVVDCDPEFGTRRSSTAGVFPLSVKFDPNFVSERPGDRKKTRKTCCTVEIAQVERELSVVGEGLVSMTFANLRSHSIEIAQETGISKFTRSQYRGVRPSIGI